MMQNFYLLISPDMQQNSYRSNIGQSGLKFQQEANSEQGAHFKSLTTVCMHTAVHKHEKYCKIWLQPWFRHKGKTCWKTQQKPTPNLIQFHFVMPAITKDFFMFTAYNNQ